MAQQFLLSAQARSLSLAAVLRMSDEQAFETFKAIRWAENNGDPFCQKCGCVAIYTYAARKIFKCKACEAQFSATSGTIFASRKMSLRDILGAIALFVNGAKGVSALQMSRDLNCQYKTAFVLLHKLRESMASEQPATVGGEVEIDGSYYGGTIRQANYKVDRQDRRSAEMQNGKRRVVVVMRERKGRTMAFVTRSEAAATSTVAEKVRNGSTVHADEGTAWDALHGKFAMKRINHSVAFSDDGACTNQAESFFSRLRRSQLGVHHQFSAKYLGQYASEMAWREDHRRVSNGEQFAKVAGAAALHPVSRNWKGYWQRNA